MAPDGLGNSGDVSGTGVSTNGVMENWTWSLAEDLGTV